MTHTEPVLTLRPNVTREEATHGFSTRGLRRWRVVHQLKPLRSVAELYVPFQLFRATIHHGKTLDVRLLAMDLFSGTLDPYSFESAPEEAELVPVTSRNRLERAVTGPQAATLLTTKLQRLMFQHGFFKVSGLTIRLETVVEVFFMPYWVGLFGSGDRASIEVLDATRRRFEGNKFRAGVRDWLCAPADPQDLLAIPVDQMRSS